MSREFLINSDGFRRLYGQFMVTWNLMDLTTDLAIGRFLKISDEEAHLITAGMMFGRKSRLLRDLVYRSDHPKKAKIIESFNKATGDVKRESIVHSYVHGDAKTVVFVERSISGPYSAREHRFTLKEFHKHVTNFTDQCVKFHYALGYSDDEIERFGEAAMSASRKPGKSPK